jgi:hypothetical protein
MILFFIDSLIPTKGDLLLLMGIYFYSQVCKDFQLFIGGSLSRKSPPQGSLFFLLLFLTSMVKNFKWEIKILSRSSIQ